MRKVDRNNSPQFRLGKSSSNDIVQHRVEPYSKTFKKKYQAFEPASISSTTNLIKTFAKSRRVDKKSPAHVDSPNRTIQRRSSSSKPNLQKPLERRSLHHQSSHHQNLSTTSKLIIINNIFSRRSLGNGPKELLQRVYDQNEEYLDLLCEWQKLEIYDEVDKLVYKLMQNYVGVIEQLMQKTYQHFGGKLQQYEKEIAGLTAENGRLKQQVRKMENNDKLFANLEDKVMEEYYRNQWSTLFLTEISKQHFDLEAFVKTIPVFTRMSALNPALSHSIIPPLPLDNHHKSVSPDRSQIHMKVKSIKSAGELSELQQIVKNRQQQAQFSIK